jgi:uncharacterized membrane protein
VADDARQLIAQAERDAEAGAMGAALRALDRAYVAVQTPRDVASVQRALTLARRIQAEPTLTGRERRRARSMVESYAELERSYSRPAPRAVATVAPRPPRGLPSLEWIHGLVGILAVFIALVLIGGLVLASAASTANERVAAIGGAIFWATILAALVAILRLLQAIERNTRSSEPDDGGRARPA